MNTFSILIVILMPVLVVLYIVIDIFGNKKKSAATQTKIGHPQTVINMTYSQDVEDLLDYGQINTGCRNEEKKYVENGSYILESTSFLQFKDKVEFIENDTINEF